MTPTFSFLTTAYRTEHCVVETIESVLAQTRNDWELIVVDNGRSEGMLRAVNPYTTDSRITFIRQENKGFLGGVAAAAALARGRYLCPLDSDDQLDSMYCETVGSLLERHPGIDAVGSDAYVYCDPDDGRPPSSYFQSVGRRSRPDPDRTVSLADMVKDSVPVYIGAFRRELWWLHHAYDPSDTTVEPDVALWLRLAAAGNDVRVLGESLARIRLRPDSLSHDRSRIEEFEARLELAYRIVGSVAGTGVPALHRVQYAQALRRARWALLDGDIASARKASSAAFRLRRGPRAALVLGGLYLAPTAMRRAHPMKNRGQELLHRIWFRTVHSDSR